MCLICNKYAQVKQVRGYHECQYCKSRIADVLPSNNTVQNVLEDHAKSYILGNRDMFDFLTYTKRLDVLKKYTKSVKTILDFGCGNGNFVKFLTSNKYQAFGFDKSEDITNHLKIQNIPFYKSEEEIPNRFFDVITCFDVIEHTTNPRIFIQNLTKKLKKGGSIVLSTPNSQSISARVLGNKWWVFGPTAHFILFSIFSLKLLLIDMKYIIISVKTDTLTPWFTPSEKFIAKILNKIVYLVLSPIKGLLFNNYLGDNIQVIARK